MATPSVRVNTFLQWKEKPFIDKLSKFYIVAEMVLGLNRLPLVICNMRFFYLPLMISYSLLLIVTIIFSTIYTYDTRYVAVVVVMNMCEYIFAIIFNFITWKRMQRFYIELSTFDAEVGCRPKVTRGSIGNLVQTLILLLLFGVFYIMSFSMDNWNDLLLPLVPVNLIHAMEVHYYGHLLSLLIPRLRLLNYYAESTLSNDKAIAAPKVEEFVYFKYNNITNGQMKKLMDLYHIIIKAYDYMVEAIKWQLLVIIITSFISILAFCYSISITIICNTDPLMDVISDMGLTIGQMIPLFSPCMFSDKVHNEVRRLRELLASRLYENKLDKSSRSTARALLALTEARDLSFSLLRMLEIDISLPFKFIGLLITYLIILLQFEKVINPDPQ
ncbi:uncharacterized protein LOC131847175 [Achroia grisella]|uniref:uncharacterized protein LOC131847175 n=1 Tax=Achroia grisella TaxID=688607 RepID=UPI0027D2F381|nr:uncharacterized protein LOC131847175 [Achroia grisella]